MIGKTNATIIIGGDPTTGDYLVRYIDIDGTVLKEQWVNSGGNATPPSNPSYDSTYLTFNTWNQVSTNITSDRDIGATYNTIDGKTYAYITISSVSGKDLVLYFNKSDSSTLSVDWGDGNISTFTGSGNINTGTHTYLDYGNFVIKIWISSGTGTYYFGNGSASTSFCGGGTQSQMNVLTKLYIGNNVLRTGDYSFYNHYSLSVVSISTTVTIISTYSFIATKIKALILTTYITTVQTNGCSYVKTLEYISLTSNLTSVASNSFRDNFIIEKIILMGGFTSIPDSLFYNNYNLKNIGNIGITSLGMTVFPYCQNFMYDFPSTLSNIGMLCFLDNINVVRYIFRRTTPPTLSNTNAFSNINSNCRIYVPDASVSAYKTATNWSTYANYIYPISTM